MTTLDTVGRVVAHARNCHIDHRIKLFVASPVQTGFALPDGDLDLFLDWARSLQDPLFTGHAPGPVGYLEVSGKVLAGDLVQITVETSGDRMRAAGLVGVLVLGQVEQFARKPVTV